MRTVYQCSRGAALIAYCLLGACHVASNSGGEGGGSNSESGGSSSEAGAVAAGGNEEQAGESAGGKHAGGASGAGAPSVDAGAAGQEAGAAGIGGKQSEPLDPATAQCDIDGGDCNSKCTGKTANCAVLPFQFFCEFGLYPLPVPVACGQTVILGNANCGGCGMVTVQLYYDGTYCWQGIPDCEAPAFAGKLINPHAPSP